ncbi:MAG TPA: 4Fe-4S dicluster domain-containing protein [Acetobacteraceae bacterium]|nr:4Fe-4S dicluster domain-containing protein [Acetobacteraceae bacterium]
MGILGIVWRNFGQRPRTLRPDDLPPTPAPFRGLIEQDAGLCTGCRACEYVCAPKAISFGDAHAKGVTWNFFAGQCSFCGLCVQFCPTNAITNRGKLPPVTGDQSQHRVSHEIMYQPCTECGRAIIPIPAAALARVYGGTLTEAETIQRSLCQECRRKAASKQIRDAFLGASNRNGNR